MMCAIYQGGREDDTSQFSKEEEKVIPLKMKHENGNGNRVMHGRKGPMVPLVKLLKRELKNEKIEKPTIRSGQAGQSKKGEDFTLIKLECHSSQRYTNICL
jgi:hypothetical protein